jgi:hypothetical protein
MKANPPPSLVLSFAYTSTLMIDMVGSSETSVNLRQVT